VSFNITILGSSGAMPAYGRFPSSQLVEIQNRYFLVDCGEGAQMQLMRFQANLHRINHILISHLHGDHYLGLMGLLFTMHLMRRTNDLHLYGHRGLDEIITTQLKHSRSVPSFKIVFHQLAPHTTATIFEDDLLTVTTIPLAHKIPCAGFLFREKIKPRRVDKTRLPEGLLIQQIANLKKGEDVLDDNGAVLYRNEDLTLPPRHSRSYAYCSDTSYLERLAEAVRGVDILYHEATFGEEDAGKATETKHSTAMQAARLAKKAEVGKLLIGHFSARYKDLASLEREARSEFESVELATEGATFAIPD
jgi:ribonuclease Z